VLVENTAADRGESRRFETARPHSAIGCWLQNGRCGQGLVHKHRHAHQPQLGHKCIQGSDFVNLLNLILEASISFGRAAGAQGLRCRSKATNGVVQHHTTRNVNTDTKTSTSTNNHQHQDQ
jgi:hypothetical protein